MRKIQQLCAKYNNSTCSSKEGKQSGQVGSLCKGASAFVFWRVMRRDCVWGLGMLHRTRKLKGNTKSANEVFDV